MDNPQSHIAYYRPGQLKKVRRARALINVFEKAMRRGEFQVYLQLQVDRHGKVVSAEVLSRWVTTSGEIISPGEFIPFLEQTGQIVRLDHYVWAGNTASEKVGRDSVFPFETVPQCIS